MAKKIKKKSAAKQAKRKIVSNPLRKQEEAVRRVYRSYMKILKADGEEPAVRCSGADYDSCWVKRRISAATATMKEFEARFQGACASVPDGFSFEDDWIRANAFPRMAYDLEEEFKTGLLGAAIWMLDIIRERGNMQAVAELLPDHVVPALVRMPDIWDSCHSEEILLGMLAVLQNRNVDCIGLEKEEKNTGMTKRRCYFDIYTVENLHKQDVPSRVIFEKMLSCIPQEAIDYAVNMYMEKYWDIVERYYRSRVIFAREEADICVEIARFDSHMGRATLELVKATQARSPLSPMNEPWLPAMMRGFPLAFPQGQTGVAIDAVSPYQVFQTARQLEQEKEKLEKRENEVAAWIYGLWGDSAGFLFRPREWIVEQYGEEIADIWDGIEIEDPYAMCFAFLYLVDRGSDYPLIYYPGVTLFSMIMNTLPWGRTRYEGSAEGVWEHFDPDTMEVVPGAAGAELPKRIKVPELEKWNRLQYLDRYEDELGYQAKLSLGQIVYEATGCIMPRNLQRYYPALLDLEAYGITGKRALHPLIYCMNLLGEGRHQSKKKPRIKEKPDGQQEEAVVQEMPQTESAEELKAKIAALQAEVDKLKQTAYQTERKLRETKKSHAEQEQKAALERQELTDLRELVFHLQEDVYEDEVEETSIKFPYYNHQRIVVFGGHDSWAREIKPRLPDVRFIDRDMIPNAEMIRRADIVWIQANAISHAYYYKILDETRKYNIPVRYFSYASALKCAEQLAEQDMIVVRN